MARIGRWRRCAVLAGVLAGTGSAIAQSGPMPGSDVALPHAVDRTYVGQNLYIPKGQQIRNIMCLFCSVQVEGDVAGRVVVLFGNLSVTGRIGGSAVVLDGNAVLDAQAHILGDTVVLLGNAVYESNDVLSGSTYVLGGHASNFEVQGKQHRRFRMSRGTLTGLGLLCGGLLALLLVGAARQRRPHPAR